jgi:hypothetical protein
VNTLPDLPSDPATPAVDAHWRSQRNLIHCIAIAVLILTGTFFVFLYRQVVMVRKNTAEMAVFLRQYDESDVSEMINRVQQRLDDYRKKDPAFNPIYVKYFGTNAPPPANTLSSKVTPGRTNVPGNTAR